MSCGGPGTADSTRDRAHHRGISAACWLRTGPDGAA